MARELITARAASHAVSVSTRRTEARTGPLPTVVLAASACESARLLLNSTGPGAPAGVANSSGKVGRYLMDHCRIRPVRDSPRAVRHAALQL